MKLQNKFLFVLCCILTWGFSIHTARPDIKLGFRDGKLRVSRKQEVKDRFGSYQSIINWVVNIQKSKNGAIEEGTINMIDMKYKLEGRTPGMFGKSIGSTNKKLKNEFSISNSEVATQEGIADKYVLGIFYLMKQFIDYSIPDYPELNKCIRRLDNKDGEFGMPMTSRNFERMFSRLNLTFPIDEHDGELKGKVVKWDDDFPLEISITGDLKLKSARIKGVVRSNIEITIKFNKDGAPSRQTIVYTGEIPGGPQKGELVTNKTIYTYK